MAATTIPTPETGFLVFSMENGYKVDDPAVLEKFAWCTGVMRAFNGHTPRYYRIRDQPDRLLQIMGWESADQHYRDFHSTEDVGRILDEFGEVLDVRSNWHAAIPVNEINLDAATITLARFFVWNEKRAEFQALMPEWTKSVAKIAGSSPVCGPRITGGWQDQDDHIDDLGKYQERLAQIHEHKELDPEDTTEWNVVLPWPSLEKWQETTSNKEQMKTFFDPLKYVARLEVLHLDPLKLPPVDPNRDDEDSEEEDC